MDTRTCTKVLLRIGRCPLRASAYRAYFAPSRLLVVLALVLSVILAQDTTRSALAATVGGRDFAVTSNMAYEGIDINLTWAAGDQQGGYWLAQFINGGFSWLGPDVTSFHYLRGWLYAGFYCWAVAPALSNQSTLLGNSDVLCAQIPELLPVDPVPQGFTLQLNQSSTARLSWVNVPGATGSVLVAFPLDGSPPRYQVLDSTTTLAADATGGTTTCYVLVTATTAAQTNTNLLCGMPGVSSFPADPAAATRTAAAVQTQATVEQRFARQQERVRSQLARLEPKVQEALREATKRLPRAPHR